MADATLATQVWQQYRSDVPVISVVDVEPRRNNTNSKIYILNVLLVWLALSSLIHALRKSVPRALVALVTAALPESSAAWSRS